MCSLKAKSNSTMRRSCLTFSLLFSLLLSGKAQSGAQEQSGTLPQEHVQKMKAASGGSKWDAVTLITADGEKESFGLTGKFHSVEEVSTGFFKSRADYGLLANAEGLDRAGRWRQDNSGQVHPLDSEEAQAVAISDAYLARRGYFFPGRVVASFKTLDAITEYGRRFDRVEVTPRNGRAIALWIDPATHLLDRVVVELSEGSKTVRYADYRRVEGLLLPFKITSEYRDDLDTGTATIAAYRVSTVTAEKEPERPAAQSSDTSIAGGVLETSAKGYLDPDISLYILAAKIDGKGPYLFVVDTGGHNILTPGMSRELGLTVVGNGFTTGAGSGSTKTQFTKVKTLSIGDAVMSDQPFTIMDFGFPMITDDGKQQPIAGILGLELFERFAITLDYKSRTATLQTPSHFTCHGNALAVPIRFTSDMPLAVATLDGHSGSFGIDTGNNTDLIVFPHWAVANQLGDRYEKGNKMKSSSVGGNVELTLAGAKSFQIAGQ